MLKDSLAVLARTAPPRRKIRFATYGATRHEIMRLCAALGVPCDVEPLYNIGAANARIVELEAQLSQRSAPAPAAAPVTTTPPAQAAPVVTTQGNVRSARDFLAMSDRDRAEFCQAGGSLTRADFNSLTPRMTMVFCSNGGRIVNDVPNQVRQPGGGAPKE